MPTIFGTENSEILNGGSGLDTIYGYGGNDTINGNAANDYLSGGANNDSLVGGSGADVIDGESGADTMSGGIGNDSLFADDLTDRVSGGDNIDFFSLGIGTTTTSLAVTFAGGAVTINGTQVADTVELIALSLGSGNDTVNAGALMSLADGTGGYLDGGNGTDTLILDYSIASPLGLTATQVNNTAGTSGTVTLSGGATRSVTFLNFERAQVTGTGGADYIAAPVGNSTLNGAGGNDSLLGSTGADSLDGGTGNDVIYGDASPGNNLDADTLLGGIGNDTLYADGLVDRVVGGAGTDYLGWATDGLTSNISAVFAGGALTLNGTEVANTVEVLSLVLGSGNDTVNAGALIPLADGTGGYLDGGDGTDTLILDYSVASALGVSAASVNIDARGGSSVTLADTTTRNLTFYSFEKAQITGTGGDDFLTAALGDSTLNGGNGIDILYGADGADLLVGGDGDDYLDGDAGGVSGSTTPADTLQGGLGNDYLLTSGLTARAVGGDGIDRLEWDISALTGNVTATFAGGALTLNGTEVANTVETLSLYLGSGSDTVTAGALMSLADGGGGFLDGGAGAGTDTAILDYSVASAFGLTAASVNITGTSGGSIAFGDGTIRFVSLRDFERVNITGSGGADFLTAATGASTLNGGGGDDNLYGDAGADLLVGGTGNDVLQANAFVGTDAVADTMQGGIGNDTISANSLVDRATGGDGVDHLDWNISNLTTAVSAVFAGGALTLNGTEVANTVETLTLSLGSGNDTVNAGALMSAVDGSGGSIEAGLGTDTLILNYSSASPLGLTATRVDLFADGTFFNTVYLADGTTRSATTSSFERAQLTGTSGDDYLRGTIGADTLTGGAGADTLEGGAGNDVFMVSGADTINENASAGTDLVMSAASFTLGANLEQLTLTGSAAVSGTGNTLSNLITGNTGNNSLNGGSGNDTLIGNGGADTLIGGANNDTFVTDGLDTITELAGGGTDSVQSSGTITLSANVENLILTGTGAIDGTGNSAANSITGNSGANLLNGGGGSDTLAGGADNDIYVTDGGDTLIENANEGTDLVRSSVNFALAANLENLELTGTATTGTGTEGANVVTGNAVANDLSGLGGNDTLDGGAGADTLTGGLGDDLYIFDGTDTILETAGGGVDRVQSDVTVTAMAEIEHVLLTGLGAVQATGNILNNTLIGNVAANRLVGLDGADTLDGGGDADTLEGGTGDDTYLTDGLDSFVELEAGGTDTVVTSATLTLASNIENLTLIGASAANGTGNALANTLIGNSAANVLDGVSGIDTLVGGLGDDTYITDGDDDIVETDNSGTDSVQSSGTYKLTAFVENLTLTGSAAVDGTGNELGNQITGNTANNILNGSFGADTLAGGAGNDTYVVDTGDVVIEQPGEGTDQVLASVSFVLGADLETLELTGALAINGSGNTSANTLRGNGAANTLDGGGGADTLIGGLGDDTYVTDGGDTITEAANAGTDLVLASATHTLTANVENLTLTGSAAINGTGNTLANVITGNGAANSLSGGTDLLVDTLIGGGGNDTYSTDGVDLVVEAVGEGTDTVRSSGSYTLTDNVENLILTGVAAVNGTGNSLANSLSGNAAANVLNGGTGVDRLAGGLGDDTYVTDGGDTITEAANAGTDLVLASATHTLAANVENLTLTGAAAINGTGNTLANVITGNGAANSLSGGTDLLVDTLIGGGGNDTYSTDGVDLVVEAVGEGTDTVRSSGSYTLTDNVENLILTGVAAVNGTGNSLANSLSGNAAANVLNGGTGVDRLAGGLGDDTYVTDGGDTITEAANAGTDLVLASATHTLAANVENLTLTGAAAINGTGNTLANVITGNDGANVISGGVGADTLSGGLGADTLTGGADADVFLFNTALDLNADRITDFDGLSDLIHLDNSIFSALADGALVGDAFLANDTGVAATATNRLVFETDTGRLLYDSDGTGTNGAIHVATFTIGTLLAGDDFFVL